MSRVNPYNSIEKRSFESALMYLLRTEYGFLGGQRVLRLLVEDVVALIEEFYPPTEQMSSGTVVWSCTADEGQKGVPGKPTEEYKTITVRLPLVTAEDLQSRTEGKTPADKRGEVARERDKTRLARMVEEAYEQGGLLTIAELSVLLNKSYEVTRQYVQAWEEETGNLLPLKGYQMDQGCRPTHKKEIVRCYENKMEPPDIARETNHDLKSVERYLKDYERVKLLLKRGMEAEAISGIIGRGVRVVLEYVALAREYHPELFTQPD